MPDGLALGEAPEVVVAARTCRVRDDLELAVLRLERDDRLALEVGALERGCVPVGAAGIDRFERTVEAA